MKRCWFGLCLLIVLLAGSLLVTVCMTRIHEPTQEAITQAADLALAEKWDQSLPLLALARENWERHWALTAAFVDHAPMETINALFCQLEVVAAIQDGPGFAGLCAHLAAQLDALGDEHDLLWWNLL